MIRRRVAILIGSSAFLLGLGLGAYLFSDSQRRSLLAVEECENCLHPNEVAGLVASVFIQRAPGLIPSVVLETDHTLVIRHPNPQAPHHYLVIPKKDIKNIGTVSVGDEETLLDMMAVIGQLVREEGLSNYRVWTNGPDNQLVAYLHFHVAGS